MKTSIFDMNFVLPPMLEMTKVEKEMPHNPGMGLHSQWWLQCTTMVGGC
jgi:hypothetical protein